MGIKKEALVEIEGERARSRAIVLKKNHSHISARIALPVIVSAGQTFRQSLKTFAQYFLKSIVHYRRFRLVGGYF